MFKAPKEEPKKAATAPIGTSCCAAPVVTNEYRFRSEQGQYTILGRFEMCMKCHAHKAPLKYLPGMEKFRDDELWAEARRTGLYVIERGPDGNLRLYINKFLRETKLGQEMLQKYELKAPEAGQ